MAEKQEMNLKIGIYVFGIASLVAGILDTIWRELDAAHQPMQGIGDNIANAKVIIYIIAISLIAGGLATLWKRTGRYGAAVLAAIYTIFGVFCSVRFYMAPHYLGYHINVYIGVLASVGMQLILIIASLIIYSFLTEGNVLSKGRVAQAVRWIFGVSTISFGLAHLTSVQSVAPTVPQWMPFGGYFWTVLTGIAFVLAGIGIITTILDILAARLLSAMLLVFSVIVLAPLIFSAPHEHISWGTNAYNLNAVSAAWLMADWLEVNRQSPDIEEKELDSTAKLV